ncbi:MAG TPA: response regulator [Pyrinomonadaceae bacterium]|nr:response regulator [Pyrinomonadaceae bacterium]
MDRASLHSFIETAETALASVRGSLLLTAQGVESTALDSAGKQLDRVVRDANEMGLLDVAVKAHECRQTLDGTSAAGALRSLDRIAEVEAELLGIDLDASFGDDVTELFDGLDAVTTIPSVDPAFAVDDDTLEIFRCEGEELLANIGLGLDILQASPSDQSALWDIRRAAHTFKGAAGIVGLAEAAALAHRMEDLLDRLVESNAAASVEVIEFLRGCVRSLGSVLDGAPANAVGLEIAYTSAAASLTSNGQPRPKPNSTAGTPNVVDHVPTVRVSLERLGDIVGLVEDLRASVGLSDEHRHQAAEIHEGLIRMRLVRFGNLETRLARAVSVTASEENKRAVLEIETPDVEIDTLIVDSLVEPLLHLLKNAVVHGIEDPDMRRMVGKHEFGLVSIRVDADSEAVVVTVSDDGAGIAISKLKERAVQRRVISAEQADRMTDREVYKLLFDRGLTTADKVDLNAGRGIGMGIVKEAIESCGGSIHIESTPQLGTTFTLMLPVDAAGKAPRTTRRGLAVSATPQLLDSPLILVVDDSASIRRHVQRLIEQAGLRCITAEDGADALETLLNGTVEPDLILSDVEMPHMDGWQLLEYIKTDDHLGHVPVVMVTSLDGDNYRAIARNLGAADYVVKPFSEKDIDRILSLVNASVSA